MERTLEESKIPLIDIREIPRWFIKEPLVILELSELPKTKLYPSTYKDKLQNILEHHPNFHCIFTDDSNK